MSVSPAMHEASGGGKAVQGKGRGEDPPPLARPPPGGDPLQVGDAVEARWIARNLETGQFYYYPATVEKVNQDTAKITVRWKSPDGFPPTLTLPADLVRRVQPAPKPKPRARKAMHHGARGPRTKLPVSTVVRPTTSSGRRVNQVYKYTPVGEDDASIIRLARELQRQEERLKNIPGEWIGEATHKDCGRTYYGAVKLLRTGVLVQKGDCVKVQPNKAMNAVWETKQEWVALVQALYEEADGTMMATMVWTYRPVDCPPLCVPPDTDMQHEVFLSAQTDDNSIRTFSDVCLVLGQPDFAARREAQRPGDIQALLCRYSYDPSREVLTPIADTQAALKAATTGRQHDKNLAALIRDFQLKWVACLLCQGKGVEETQSASSMSTPPPSSSPTGAGVQSGRSYGRWGAFFDASSSSSSSCKSPLSAPSCDGDAGAGAGRSAEAPKGGVGGKRRADAEPAKRPTSDAGRNGGGKRAKKGEKPPPVKFEFAEYVEAKWDDGLYYPALIQRRIAKRKGLPDRVMVEWVDPPGHPRYWESAGYSKTSDVPVTCVRASKTPPPDHVINAQPVGERRDDWDLVARKAEQEKRAADGGVEWYPKLRVEEAAARKGYRRMWVCTNGLCGRAFADYHFLRAHQLSHGHGRWNGLAPAVTEGGKMTLAELDCTRSGLNWIGSTSVERKLKKLVKQTASSEEERLSFDTEVPCKVLHTGHTKKGFGLYASKAIKKGEFLGHYSGQIRDIGYVRGRSYHYTFHLLHELGVDGTCGGAFRFMNHCLEREEPTVKALIVNHRGVPHVALYALKDLVHGEELLLRYGNMSDLEFFEDELGLD